ncbi:MAG: glycosyltransferase [Rikenellaceae bacterium]
MKQRIFIAIHYMEIGGAEISLIGLLNAIDYSLYDVDLFVYSHRGEFMSLIPKEVNLLSEDMKYASIEKPMTTALKSGYVDIVAARLWAKVQFKRYAKKSNLTDGSAILQYISDNTTPLLKSLHYLGEYDLAISFVTPHTIVRKKVRAKKKIAWIHTDYTNISVNSEKELPDWSSYDYIASISEEVGKKFCQVFPTLKEKLALIENILSPTFVRERSRMASAEDMPQIDGEYRFLSVGRYSHPKNFDNLPFIAKSLLVKGLKFKWYIIGYGGDEALIKSKIAEAGVEQTVILLGKKSNPYPYMAACDFYIQPSRYEGKSVTVREAQMLYKPVVVTNYPTASSQIKSGVDGVIVPLENDSCASGIYEFIANKELQESIIGHLRDNDYGNETEVEKLYKLI